MQTPRPHSPRPRELTRRSSRRETPAPTIDTLQTLLSPTRPVVSRVPSKGTPRNGRSREADAHTLARHLSSREGDDRGPPLDARESDSGKARGSRDDGVSREPARRSSERSTDDARLREPARRSSERSRSGERSSDNWESPTREFQRHVSFAEYATNIGCLPGDSSEDDAPVQVPVTPRGRATERGPGRRSATPFVARRLSSRDHDDAEDEQARVVTCHHCGHLVRLAYAVVGGVDIQPGS